jgi:maleate isomerase
MYGWKGRIGLLIPHRNTTTEPELARMIPDGVTIHVARMILGDITPEGLRAMEEEVYKAATVIDAVNPDLIVVCCTSGSFVGGKGYDHRLSEKITSLTKVPAVTTSTAVVEAMRHFRMKTVAIATPFSDEVNQKESEFVEANGIKVTKIRGLGYAQTVTQYPLASRPTSGIGLLPPAVAYRLALDVNTPNADGIFISCANFRTLEIIEALEQNTGKPVITSNQATLAMALKMMGIREKISGYGSLLSGSFR